MLENIFNLQTKEEKAVYTWEFGIFLASRTERNQVINLYSVDDFFVEVWYNPERKLVQMVNSFSSCSCFDPYLVDIVICA